MNTLTIINTIITCTSLSIALFLRVQYNLQVKRYDELNSKINYYFKNKLNEEDQLSNTEITIKQSNYFNQQEVGKEYSCHVWNSGYKVYMCATVCASLKNCQVKNALSKINSGF